MPFPQSMQRTILEWSSSLFSDKEWVIDTQLINKIEPGIEGGCEVRTEDNKFRCWLKPLKPTSLEHHNRAANEKIAADIAAKLNLLVPPVMLVPREKHPKVCGQHSCVSLFLFPNISELQKVSNLPENARKIVEKELAATSGMVAFDTFVGNWDRKKDKNIVFGSNPRDMRKFSENSYIFLDYADSMNCSNNWANGGWKKPIIPFPVHELFRGCIDETILEETIQKIEHLPDEFFDLVVGRIPEEFMPKKDKEATIEGLKGRRGLIRMEIAHFGLLNEARDETQ
jgi:hypothetical protein